MCGHTSECHQRPEETLPNPTHLVVCAGDAVLGLKLLQHRIQVVAAAVVDEEAAHVGLRLVADHLRYRLEVAPVLADPCNDTSLAVGSLPSTFFKASLAYIHN